MTRPRLTARVVPPEGWPDSRADQRAYWRSRPPSERIEAGRAFHQSICRWFHLRGPTIQEALRSARARA